MSSATPPRGLPRVDGVEHAFVDAGGLRTHVALAGEGPPLLLLHGWPQHWYLWRELIPRLAPHARVICPDLRGFGWTDVPASGYDKPQLKRDVLALLDALGIERVAVAGHDWGGYVGFLLGMEDPGRVERLLVLNSLPPWPGRDPRALRDAWRLAYMPVLGTPGLGRRAGRALAEQGLRSARLAPAEVEAFVSRLEGERGRATERLYGSFVRELPAIVRGRHSPGDLAVPARLLFGVRDVVLRTRAARDAAARSERLELELVEGAGHFVVDERPDLVAERLLELVGD